ncbi:MAG: microcin C ABC transporter permease YejB [Alphaproteobacteria bacterium]
MIRYLTKRLFLIFPTLLGIMLINFAIVQAAPGGPVEQMVAQISGNAVSATARISNTDTAEVSSTSSTETASHYKGREGLDPALIKKIEKMYGFDKPAHVRFFDMLKNYLQFDFGESFFKGKRVVQLIKEKIPVSISLGIWTTLLIYLISIPLGIKKATRDGSKFDLWTSTVIIIGYAIPGFLFAILLIVLFAGGQFFDLFPLKGLVSNNWHELSLPMKVIDYLWHMILPVTAMVIGGFAGLTMLTKNLFIEELGKQYVLTARAKGVSEKRVLYGHVFRNAMLIVVAGFPSAFIGIFFTGSVLIEVIFSLDGLGLLGFEAAMNRDYPIVFASLYIFTLLGLLMNIIGDLMYTFIDPRIDFEAQQS